MALVVVVFAGLADVHCNTVVVATVVEEVAGTVVVGRMRFGTGVG